jgi:hypothetical protein
MHVTCITFLIWHVFDISRDFQKEWPRIIRGTCIIQTACETISGSCTLTSFHKISQFPLQSWTMSILTYFYFLEKEMYVYETIILTMIICVSCAHLFQILNWLSDLQQILHEHYINKEVHQYLTVLTFKQVKKVKLCLYIAWRHMGEWGIEPHILNLGTNRKKVVSLKTWLIYTRGHKLK